MTTNARTDPDTGLRWYRWEGIDYPSVTSIRRLIGLEFSLHQWTLTKVIDRAVDDYAALGEKLHRDAKPKERTTAKNARAEAAKWLRSAATEDRDRAGDRGTRVHDAIHQMQPPEKADPDARGYLYQFYDFMAERKAEVLWAERQVFNLREGYAGTADALMRIGGRTFLVDYKTGKGVYLDHAIQLIAYTMGEFVGADDRIDREATRMLHAADGMAVLHLSEDGWEFIEVKPSPQLFRAFTSSLVFARFLSDNRQSIEDLVVLPKTVGGTLVPALAAALTLVEGGVTVTDPADPAVVGVIKSNTTGDTTE